MVARRNPLFAVERKICRRRNFAKTYIEDCISKTVKKNNGELPKYYVKDNHAAIVDRDLFNRVQEELARRAGKQKVSQKKTKTENGKYSGKYALSELLVCGECGTAYRRVTWSRDGVKRIVWRCLNRLEFGTKFCKASPTIEEDKLHSAILTATKEMFLNLDEVRDVLKESLTLAVTSEDDGFDRTAAETAIKEKQAVMLDLVRLTTKSGQTAENTTEYLDEKFAEISVEIKSLQDKLSAHDKTQSSTRNANARLSEILALVDADALDLTDYDDRLTRQTVERVTALPDGVVRIAFKTGYETTIAL